MTGTLRNRIEGLNAEERMLLLQTLSEQHDLGAKKSSKESSRHLKAYVTTDGTLNPEELKIYLRSRLPAYMIPAQIVEIDTIPTLPNGKVDKEVLRSFGQNTGTGKENLSEKPTNEIEERLVTIWKEVLKIDFIGINDNFFEIGGDSISSILIIAKARKIGLYLDPNQLFEHQTIAELALFTKHRNDVPLPDQFDEGTVQMTPIQHWFFKTHTAAPHFWNHIVQMTGSHIIRSTEVAQITNRLVSYHPALRLSFKHDGNDWVASVKPSAGYPECHLAYDLEAYTTVPAQEEAISAKLTEIQSACDLSEGPLFRSVYFNCNGLQEGKIFFIAHHLVIDIVSWNSIFNDLTHALDRISARKEFSFKPQTASLSSWGERLQELARSQELLQELPYWNTQRAMGKYFPSDFKYSRQIYLNRDIARYQQKLDPAATKLLLQQANKTYTTKTEDLLLTALLMGIGKWSKTNKVLIGLERHGRSPGITSLDISNTVGWFTSFFPVLLGFDHHLPLGNKIKTIKEQLRAVPNDGIGYGTLKYLSNDNTISESLDQVPELIYNYMGILGNNAEHTDLGFRFIQGISQDPRSERSYSIEINSYISDGSLVVNWSYSSLVFRESTIITLAAEIEKYLKDLIDHSVSKNEIEYTPSDFPEADLSQNDLDKLMRSLNE